MSKKLSILIPDDLHINQRNFGSFFKFVERNGAATYFEKERRDWVALYGKYEEKAGVLNERSRALAHLSPDVLFDYTVKGVNLFKVARAEILARVAVLPEWYETAYPTTARGIFDKLLVKNRAVLLQNLAAAWDWLEFWSGRLADKRTFTHCCVFSGSLIYQRSLIELLRFTPTRVMVMESFFTGNDYYCEEKYEPIANNCDIRHKAVYAALKSTGDDNVSDRERMKAINKVILANNKNVKQPDAGEPIRFEDAAAPIVTVLGQVVNDFSLLEYHQLGLSSIAFYQALMQALTDAGFNVVFKAHPWEEKKSNVKGALTRDVLNAFVATLTETQQQRIRIVDHYPIDELFRISSWAVGLNSQSLLEASFQGLKPVQFGNAFFGQRGFTHDYRIEDIEGFVADARAGRISGTLSLAEFRGYEDFLFRLLQGQLVSIHDSGVARLSAVFETPATIGLARRSVVRAPTEPKAGVAAAPAPTPVLGKAIGVQSAADSEPEVLPALPATEFGFARKHKKFRTNPRKFFADSRNPLVRPLRHLFSHVA